MEKKEKMTNLATQAKHKRASYSNIYANPPFIRPANHAAVAESYNGFHILKKNLNLNLCNVCL